MLKPDTELRYLKGVGPRRAERLREVGLETVEDLLYVLPFRYEDRRALRALSDLGCACVIATNADGSAASRSAEEVFLAR